MAALGRMKPTSEFLGISKGQDEVGLLRSGTEAIVHAPSETSNYSDWKNEVDSAQDREAHLLDQLLAEGVSVQEFTNIYFENVHKNEPERTEACKAVDQLMDTEDHRFFLDTFYRLSSLATADTPVSHYDRIRNHCIS